MTLTGFLIFAATYAMAVASPGPGVAALVARVLARGPRGIWAFILGIMMGDLLWLTIAATGLAVLAQAWSGLITIVRLAGAAYLMYIAWTLWTSAAKPQQEGQSDDTPSPIKLLASGLSLSFGNPKVIVFFMALLPALVDLDHLTIPDFLAIFLLCGLILGAIMATYALCAHHARTLFRSPQALQRLNRTTGVIVAGAAVAIATKS